MTHPYLAGSSAPRVFAHRGLVTEPLRERGIVENSRAAVVAAIEVGAHYVESDCHLTRDGAVVLFHDEKLSRVLGDARAVSEVSYSELHELMADHGGLLTLEQLLDEFSSTKFNIDVKSDAVAEPAGRIIGAHTDRVLLTSFDDARRQRALTAARTVRGASPATSPGKSRLVRLLLAGVLRSPRQATRALAGVDAVQIPESYRGVKVLSQRLLDTVHGRGAEVHVWTVNDPTRMQQLVAMGVDGIITDRADLALQALG